MEIKAEDSGFYARFLGGFSLRYRGNPLSLNANPQTGYMQIMLCLLKAGKEGMGRKELLAINQPEHKDHKQRSNNFRQQVYMLRNAIARAGFPQGQYIVLYQSRYYFTRAYEMQSDTGELDVLIEQIRTGVLCQERQREIYLQYCGAYTGEFLPQLNGEDWVTLESAYYQKWYTTCLKGLSRILKAEREYELLLKLSTDASQYHPYDEWQAVRIDCLLALERHREAQKVYKEAAELYEWEWGRDFLDQVMSEHHEEHRIYYMDRAMKRVKDKLKEHGEGKGGYRCSVPSFVDICRLWARLGEERMEEHLLMLCILHNRSWSEEIDGRSGAKECEEKNGDGEMELFQAILNRTVRAQDVYTRYSQRQYLVLLTDMELSLGYFMKSRLEGLWKLAGGGGLEVELDRLSGSEDMKRKEKTGAEKSLRTVCLYQKA